jgi:O-antigen ligase
VIASPASPASPPLSSAWTVNLALAAWLAMFCSILIWSGSVESAGPVIGNSQNYYRIVLVLSAAGACALILMQDPKTWFRAFPGPLILLLIYGLAAMVSSAYIPEYAFYSLWKSFEILVDVLTIAAILSYADNLNAARTAYRVLLTLNGLLVITYLIEGWAMPAEAFHSARGYLKIQLMGVRPVMQANALAFLSAMTAFGAFCRLFRPASAWVRLGYGSFLALALVTLVLAQSRTSFVGFCLAVVTYLVFDRRFVPILVIAGVALVAGSYLSLFEISSQYLLRGQDPELVGSLSGRTHGWAGAWEAFQEAPILGHGFVAYARAVILSNEGITSLHGSVFEVMVGTGLVGLITWGGAIVWTVFRLFFLPSSGHPWFADPVGRSLQAEMLGVIVLILIRASTSSGLAEHDDNFMLFLTVLAYTTSMRGALDSAQQQDGLPEGATAKA